MGTLKSISNIVKYGFYVLIFGLVFATGWVGGRKTMKLPAPEVITEYVEGEPIHDTCYVDNPIKVKVPADTLDIIKKCVADGIYKDLWPKEKEYIEVPSKEDTTAIMKDWATERRYKETLFNTEENGKCVVEAKVQYNRLDLIGYEFTPVVQKVTEKIYTVKEWSPFIEAGYKSNIFNKEPEHFGEVGVGMFYKEKYGFEFNYQRGFVQKNDFLGASFFYKF